MKIFKFDPEWRISPGGTLQEQMTHNQIDLRQIARITGLPSKELQAIIDGEQHITEQVAKALAKTGIPAFLWLNLERTYRTALAANIER